MILFFPILNQSVFPYLVLTVASWLTYRRQVRWSGITIFLRILNNFVIHTVKSFSIVYEAEVDFFPECLFILHDPTKASNLISSSSAYSKPSLNAWRCSVHILLKHTLNDFKHNLASTWNDHNWTVVWTFFAIALLWDWSENWLFPVLLSFPKLGAGRHSEKVQRRKENSLIGYRLAPRWMFVTCCPWHFDLSPWGMYITLVSNAGRQDIWDTSV